MIPIGGLCPWRCAFSFHPPWPVTLHLCTERSLNYSPLSNRPLGAHSRVTSNPERFSLLHMEIHTFCFLFVEFQTLGRRWSGGEREDKGRQSPPRAPCHLCTPRWARERAEWLRGGNSSRLTQLTTVVSSSLTQTRLRHSQLQHHKATQSEKTRKRQHCLVEMVVRHVSFDFLKSQCESISSI